MRERVRPAAAPAGAGRPSLAFLVSACILLAGCERRAGPPDALEGARVFAARCASCHGIGPSAHNGFGPQLNALFGRRAGGAPGYAYSAAMKQSRVTWNDASLRAFIAAPEDVVPGTKMRFWGMSDEQQVADLLAYLREAGTAAPDTAQPAIPAR